MRFFFYGTLMAGSDNPVARFVHDHLRAIGPAQAQGVLHGVPNAAGWYPALLPGEGVARGMLYEAAGTFGAAELARLDAYEDYDPARPEVSLYLRAPIAVSDGEVAEAYIFNQPLPAGSRPIPGGDFRAWLAAEGLEQFRGLRDSGPPGEAPRG